MTESCPDCNYLRSPAAPCKCGKVMARPKCRGCGQEIDDETCYCGEPIPGSCDNHNPTPMGCECHLRHQDLEPEEF